jgi:hypothetical protein
MAEVVVGIANVRHVKCIAPPVRTVGRRPRYLFSRVVIGPCIAVNVINLNVLVTRVTEDRVGNIHDRVLGKARRFIRVGAQTVQS